MSAGEGSAQGDARTPRRSGLRNRLRAFRGPRPVKEWVGGTIVCPWDVAGYDEPPDLAVWIELPEELVVGCEDPQPGKDGLSETLRAALAEPLIGKPRRPDALRVADDRAARAVRAVVAGDIPVRVGDTPEIRECQARLHTDFAALEKHDPAFIVSGGVDEALKRLFRATRDLFRAAPWTIVDESVAFGLNVPSLGVEGACVSIEGGYGNLRGFIVHPSYEALDRILDAEPDLDADLSELEMLAGTITVAFHSEEEVAPSILAEVREYAWPVAGPDAYPFVYCVDEEGNPRDTGPRDSEIASAASHAFAKLFTEHRNLFGGTDLPWFSKIFRDDAERRIEITFPHPALVAAFEAEPVDFNDPRGLPGPPDLADALTPAPFRPRVARNAPCPCGSGRKYKKCHLRKDEEKHFEIARATTMHRLDSLLVHELVRFAISRFEDEWRVYEEDFVHQKAASQAQFAAPWAVYDFAMRGRTVADIYREAHPERISEAEHRWMDAQRAAWLSVWEVEAVEPGRSITLLDLLSGERRRVIEVRGSQSLAKREALLARIVDYEGMSLLCSHGLTLPPRRVDEVLEAARRRLHSARATPVERLRDPKIGRFLIRHWERATETAASDRARPDRSPALGNRDGDPLLFTVDHFDLEAGAAADAGRRVSALEGARRDESEKDGPPAWVLLRSDASAGLARRSTVVGRIVVDGRTMRAETNSVSRADALRERIEAACGPLVRHRVREHTDPLAFAEKQKTSRREPISPEEAELTMATKAEHYADWPDHPLPALQGRTPRSCMGTEAGRQDVDRVLKEMEYREERAPGPSFDFDIVRRDLGLDTG